MKGRHNTVRAYARAPLSIATPLLALVWVGASAAEVAAKPVNYVLEVGSFTSAP